MVSANAALEYFTLESRTLRLGSSRKEELEAEYQRLKTDMHSATRIATDLQRVIRASRETHPSFFVALRRGGPANIELTIPPESERFHELAESVALRLVLRDSSTGNEVGLRGRLVHMGVSVFETEAGDSTIIRVPPRAAVVVASSEVESLSIANARNLVGRTGEIVGVSPYGVWRALIPGLQTEIETIEAIEFVFFGSAGVSTNLSSHAVGMSAAQQTPPASLSIASSTAVSPDVSEQRAMRLFELERALFSEGMVSPPS